ncbi:hypothetical protein, partial [Candidatus Brocadia sapporoensis]|uniref:hypothetical protein n=1 Tax=Candidatus Brocadia sapporoensis TaxID=392547 RepID=UPI001E5953B7
GIFPSARFPYRLLTILRKDSLSPSVSLNSYVTRRISCNSDVGVTLMHDHNPRAMISAGKIYHGRFDGFLIKDRG